MPLSICSQMVTQAIIIMTSDLGREELLKDFIDNNLHSQQYTSLHEMLSNFSKVLIVQISFTAVINNGSIGGIRKAPRRIIFTFCDLLCDVRDEKRKQSRGAQIILPPCPKTFSNFSQLRLFLFVGPAKPLWSLVFV